MVSIFTASLAAIFLTISFRLSALLRVFTESKGCFARVSICFVSSVSFLASGRCAFSWAFPTHTIHPKKKKISCFITSSSKPRKGNGFKKTQMINKTQNMRQKKTAPNGAVLKSISNRLSFE